MTGIAGEHAAWVLDGADDPLADKSQCSHGAIWYVQTLHQALTQSLSEGHPALPPVLERAIRYVRKKHEAECDHPSHRKPSAAVAILRCSSESIDYLVLGDASIVIESSEGVVHVTDRRMHRIGRATRHTILNRLRQGHGYDDPERSILIKELVAQEQRARNTTSGYYIAAYDPAAAFGAVTEAFPFSTSETTINRTALFSDGAERAVSTFGLCPNWQSFLEVASTKGPSEWIKRIREAEALDSSGNEHPRTKFSDDASIILWTRGT